MRRFGKKFRIHLNHPICNHLTNKKFSSAENFPSRLKICQTFEFSNAFRCLVNHCMQSSNNTVGQTFWRLPTVATLERMSTQKKIDTTNFFHLLHNFKFDVKNEFYISLRVYAYIFFGENSNFEILMHT